MSKGREWLRGIFCLSVAVVVMVLVSCGRQKRSLCRQEVLYCRARYCEAMTEVDTDTMRELMAEDLMLTHMSGRQQTREEYLADVASEELRYYHIGIESPVIEVSGNQAVLTSTSALTANAYGAEGTFRMEGTSYYERRDGNWIMINKPK